MIRPAKAHFPEEIVFVIEVKNDLLTALGKPADFDPPFNDQIEGLAVVLGIVNDLVLLEFPDGSARQQRERVLRPERKHGKIRRRRRHALPLVSSVGNRVEAPEGGHVWCTSRCKSRLALGKG